MAETSYEVWFYDSIFRYKNLNMFELEYPVQNLEPTGSSDVCVSCSNGKRHQLLQLSLPMTLVLTASKTAQMAITNDNDLKIKCGTYCQSMVANMKLAGGDVVIASHVNSNILTTYKLNVDDSDEMKKLAMWKCELESPNLSVSDDELVLSESGSSSAFVMDIKTGEQIGKIAPEDRDSADVVWPVHVEPRTVGLCYQFSGRVDFYDTRQLQRIGCIHRQPEKLESWSFTSEYESSRLPSGDHCIATVSNRGRLKMYDSRNWNTPFLNERTGLSATKPMSRARLRLKPSGRNWASVSGLDGNVYVLELKPEPELVFTHDGHKHVEGFSSIAVTTGHVWLPGAADAIVSSADNGTVQSWRFEDRRIVGDS